MLARLADVIYWFGCIVAAVILAGGEFAAQVEDVRARGLQEPIVLYEGMILDGRIRYRACVEAGIEPRFRETLFNCYADAVGLRS